MLGVAVGRVKTHRGVGMAYSDPQHPKHLTVDIRGEQFFVPRERVTFVKKKEAVK